MLHGALLCATAADILTVVALREYICAKEGNHTTCGTRPWPASVSWAEIAAQRAQQSGARAVRFGWDPPGGIVGVEHAVV